MTPTNRPPSDPPARQATHHPASGKPTAGHSHDDHLYDDEFVHNEDVAHEHTDVNVRQLLLYTGGLAATCLVCAAIVWGLFGVFERQAAANDPAISPLAAPAGQNPPAPRLLTDEPAMLKKQRSIEAETLEHFAWIDQQKGVARLPIAEAKKKLLHDGLPVRAEPSTDAWMGTRPGTRGESSGGRAIPSPSRSEVLIQRLEADTKKPDQGTKPPEPRKPH